MLCLLCPPIALACSPASALAAEAATGASPSPVVDPPRTTEPTNALVAVLLGRYDRPCWPPYLIIVSITRSGSTNPSGASSISASNAISPLAAPPTPGGQYPVGHYFMATNSFCGPVQLLDPSGRPVPLLRPQLNSTNAYPPLYSLNAFRTNYVRAEIAGEVPRHPHFWPAGSPAVVVFDKPLPAINLSELFAIREPGNYRFTLWPKIYVRTSPGGDTCQRLDLPPISVSLTLEVEKHK
jgi:hypothetical protein